MYALVLNNEHSVTVRIEAVTLGDRRPVVGAAALHVRVRRHHHPGCAEAALGRVVVGERLLDDPAALRREIVASRSLIDELFSPDSVTQRTIALYEGLARSRSPG